MNESKNARKLGLNFLFRKSGNYSLMMNVPMRALLNNYFYYFKNFKERCVYRTLSISSNYHPIVEYFFLEGKEEKEKEKELKRRYGASGLTHGVVAYRVMCHWAGRNRGKPG